MSDIIIYTLVLALVQIWLLPMFLNLNNTAWLLSNRDDEVDTSVMHQRAARASANLQASLPAFLALCLLSMQMDIDITTSATYWLGLRIIYIPLYLFGVSMLRSLSWMASVACMVHMAMQLV